MGPCVRAGQRYAATRAQLVRNPRQLFEGWSHFADVHDQRPAIDSVVRRLVAGWMWRSGDIYRSIRICVFLKARNTAPCTRPFRSAIYGFYNIVQWEQRRQVEGNGSAAQKQPARIYSVTKEVQKSLRKTATRRGTKSTAESRHTTNHVHFRI